LCLFSLRVFYGVARQLDSMGLRAHARIYT
jgi:hypothetical protein